MTLAEFVAARLDERQEQAERDIKFYEADCVVSESKGAEPRAMWIVHLAGVILGTVEAQRATLARHEGCGRGWGYCDLDSRGLIALYAGRGCPDILDLAAPDHEHPDFNPVWKTEETS